MLLLDLMKKVKRLFSPEIVTGFVLLFLASCNYKRVQTDNKESIAESTKFTETCVTGEDSVYSIGNIFGGGIIFFVDSTGQHGLIVSLIDVSKGIPWGPYGKGVMDCNSRDQGLENTQNILNAYGNAECAVLTCKNYRGGGYYDWYLPALNELKKLDEVKSTINKILKILGNKEETEYIALGDYWSSTEYDDYVAWAYRFRNGIGYADPDGKYAEYKVRAVRKF